VSGLRGGGVIDASLGIVCSLLLADHADLGATAEAGDRVRGGGSFLRPPPSRILDRIVRILFWAVLMWYAWGVFATNAAKESCIRDGLDGLCKGQ
jgi:hypothetical protein